MNSLFMWFIYTFYSTISEIERFSFEESKNKIFVRYENLFSLIWVWALRILNNYRLVLIWIDIRHYWLLIQIESVYQISIRSLCTHIEKYKHLVWLTCVASNLCVTTTVKCPIQIFNMKIGLYRLLYILCQTERFQTN